MGDFRFEEEFFPDPDAMVKELKEMGMELMVSVWPQIDTQSENFAEMKQKGLLVKTEHGVEICMRFGGESVFFDPTNPAARRYVWDKCRQNYYDKGIRVFWLDEAEPEYLATTMTIIATILDQIIRLEMSTHNISLVLSMMA